MDGGLTATVLLGQVDIRPGDVFQERFDQVRREYVVTHNGQDTGIADEDKSVIRGIIASFQRAVGHFAAQGIRPSTIPVTAVTAQDIWG